MKKRVVLGSAILAMLMLVSIQIVFLDTAKSAPEAHEGDAVAGTMWLSELDVSSDLTHIDYIGVPHVNATDDWVVWITGEGDIIANWSVDISNNHPEYYAVFSLLVLNADDSGSAIGSDYFDKTYNANTSYDESGTLTCDIDLTSVLSAGEQTLVCYVGAMVMINDTSEAKNFTIWADDRCVVAVDFTMPRGGSFDPFVVEANDEIEPDWAYLDGWSSQFSSEDDMLNTQTVIVPGLFVENDDNNWDLGDFDVDWNPSSGHFDDSTWTDDDSDVSWPPLNEDNDVEGTAEWHWSVNDHSFHDPPLMMRVKLKIVSPDVEGSARGNRKLWYDSNGDVNSGTEKFTAFVDGDNDNAPLDEIAITGFVRVRNVRAKCWCDTFPGYKIYIDAEAPPSSGSSHVNWRYEFASLTGAYTVGLTGTTDINVDISGGIVSSNEEFLYIFAGDTGETTVTLTI